MYYEQQGSKEKLELEFNDQTLKDVEQEWKRVSSLDKEFPFMVFEERNGMGDEDEDEGY